MDASGTELKASRQAARGNARQGRTFCVSHEQCINRDPTSHVGMRSDDLGRRRRATRLLRKVQTLVQKRLKSCLQRLRLPETTGGNFARVETKVVQLLMFRVHMQIREITGMHWTAST